MGVVPRQTSMGLLLMLICEWNSMSVKICSPRCIGIAAIWGLEVFCICVSLGQAADRKIDFNRDIRPILSNNCYQCHGPDAEDRKGGIDGLRLDTFDGATVDLGGYQAIAPGEPEKSDLLSRITTEDVDLHMPPLSSGKKVSKVEVQLLRKWIQQGAKYAEHWSFVKPVRSPLPEVMLTEWPRNEIDHFILAKLEQHGHAPSVKADRRTIARRVCLDLTGLPPASEELQAFLEDSAPDAYEHYVDRLLAKKSFGEHWARMWLDLARYADSAGYADDPERTIWLYRDYVIRSFNDNKPFDQFTIEQLAGDLLPNPTDDQRIATAFHRNTLTNNEGGTNDEEFRNVAVIDRVNTTLSAWMGLTMACAQCHTHKFDPITQAEYFSVFAIFNNTADADRKDESPLFSQFTPGQLQEREHLEKQIRDAENALNTPTQELLAALEKWQTELSREPVWKTLRPSSVVSAGKSTVSIDEEQVVSVSAGAIWDTYTMDLPLPGGPLSAVQLEVLPHPSLPNGGPGHANGNFVLSQVSATLIPDPAQSVQGRYVRIGLPGKDRYLSLAEVQVFQGSRNIAPTGTATQISTSYDGVAALAIDGNTNGAFFKSRSVTHTEKGDDLWWELDLLSDQVIDRVAIWNRADGNIGSRLSNFMVMVLDANRRLVWKKQIVEPPTPSTELWMNEPADVEFATALADYSQSGFPAEAVLQGSGKSGKGDQGWAIGGGQGQPHRLTLIMKEACSPPPGSILRLTLEQNSKHNRHTIGRFRVKVSEDPGVAVWGQIPQSVVDILNRTVADRTPQQAQILQTYFVKTTPLLGDSRKQIETLRQHWEGINPVTVPVCEELPEGKRRMTHIQLRGNYLNLGDEVGPGTPAAFPPIPSGFPANRLGLAHWLVDNENPLTARVLANRCWEQIFGIGLVATSEDFGSQGELPSHPELLDWLATEIIRLNWDTKAFLKLLVTSATYRQSSRVTPEQFQEDPDNRLLSRGPRFRLPAETIRDQALALSGLLSEKMYGPPVKPPQPASGLRAAFGGAVDWKISDGEDRYRRGIYTSWRRSNPYPSMATFDAPNREVCTIRRDRTNTPLQALVTLNDPVYIEAAQGLARRSMRAEKSQLEEPLKFMLQLCLGREPHPTEWNRLTELRAEALQHFEAHPREATTMATVPLGPVPNGMDVKELAALTVVANVVLNLDEVLMKP